jgi:hypothetical protein
MKVMNFTRLVLKKRFEIKFETRFDPGLTSAYRGRLRGKLLLAYTDSGLGMEQRTLDLDLTVGKRFPHLGFPDLTGNGWTTALRHGGHRR